MSALLAGLLGLALGSFLTVVVDRVPRGESVVWPGSRCPRCGTQVAPYHNVPVLSWVVLRGRCRTCGEPIPARYVVLEAGTAAAFVLGALRLGVDAVLPAYLIVVLVHLAAAVIEWQGDSLPSPAMHVAAALVLASFGAGALAIGEGWSDPVRGLLAAAGSGVVLAGARLPGAQVVLGALTGLALGWAGVANLAAGAAVALAVALALRHRRRTALALTAGLVVGLFLP